MNKEEKVFSNTVINWYPGHMAKAKRELKENMQFIDVVYEIVDARMPLSSKMVDIDDIVKDKPKILVVSKYDLCDKNITDMILKKYSNYVVVKCDLINGTTNELINKTKEISKQINDQFINPTYDDFDCDVMYINQCTAKKKIVGYTLSEFDECIKIDEKKEKSLWF